MNLPSLTPLQGLTAARLRHDFDAAFGEAPPAAVPAGQALLAVSIGGDPYALRVAEITGLVRDRRVAPLPQVSGGFMGLCGQRGVLLPVWDLAVMLGYAASRVQTPWLAMPVGEPAWALAFERFDGYLSLSLDGLRPYVGQGSAAAFARSAALDQGRLRPVLDLLKLRESIRTGDPSKHPRST